MRRSPRGGMLRLALMAAALVAAALLAAVLAGGHARASSPPSSKPLHSDWQLSPEFPASDPVYVDAATSQSRPKMAFDGTNYLVVWQEDRDYQYGDVYAARVTPDGTVLDPFGIPIAAAGAWQGNPAVAFDGTNYLVTWSERGYPDGDVYAARVSPAGTVLDPNGFPVAAGPGLQDYSAVAFDGTNYLVTWMDEDPNTLEADVYAARVTPSGAVLSSS